MSWDTIILQLGISGLVVYAGFKIAVLIINKWAAGDVQRTQAIAAGFAAITSSHEKVIETMNIHQQNEISILNAQVTAIQRLDSKIDTALDLTPVHGIRRDPPSTVIVAPEAHERQPDPVKSRTPSRPQSSPGEYGLLSERPFKK